MSGWSSRSAPHDAPFYSTICLNGGTIDEKGTKNNKKSITMSKRRVSLSKRKDQTDDQLSGSNYYTTMRHTGTFSFCQHFATIC